MRSEKIEPQGAIELARYELAHEFLAALTRIDEQMRQTKKRIAVAVTASGTTVTEIYVVGARSSFEPLGGKNLVGSSSFENQTAQAAGRHFGSNPTKPSNATN